MTNQVTSWHFVVALLPSPVVECMSSSGPKMHWSVESTLIVQGGHDLGGFKDYDICIRTDKHGQSIHGSSSHLAEMAYTTFF